MLSRHRHGFLDIAGTQGYHGLTSLRSTGYAGLVAFGLVDQKGNREEYVVVDVSGAGTKRWRVGQDVLRGTAEPLASR